MIQKIKRIVSPKFNPNDVHKNTYFVSLLIVAASVGFTILRCRFYGKQLRVSLFILFPIMLNKFFN